MSLSWGHNKLVADKNSTLFVFCLILEGCLTLGSSKLWKKQVGYCLFIFDSFCLYLCVFVCLFVCLFLIDECKRWAPGGIVLTSLLFLLEIHFRPWKSLWKNFICPTCSWIMFLTCFLKRNWEWRNKPLNTYNCISIYNGPESRCNIPRIPLN